MIRKYLFDDPARTSEHSVANVSSRSRNCDEVCFPLNRSHINSVPDEIGVFLIKGETIGEKKPEVAFVGMANAQDAKLRHVFKAHIAKQTIPSFLGGLFQHYVNIVFCYCLVAEELLEKKRDELVAVYTPPFNSTPQAVGAGNAAW